MSNNEAHAAMYIDTVAQNKINTFTPDPDTIFIEDIAHSLAQLPRFGGHCPVHLSVAQHCLTVAQLAQTDGNMPREAVLWALLHDAHEALGLGDICSPTRRAVFLDFKHQLADLLRHAPGVSIQEANAMLSAVQDPVKKWKQKADFAIAVAFSIDWEVVQEYAGAIKLLDQQVEEIEQRWRHGKGQLLPVAGAVSLQDQPLGFADAKAAFLSVFNSLQP